MNNDNAADAIESYCLVGYNQQDIHEFLRVYQGVDIVRIYFINVNIAKRCYCIGRVCVCICVSVCRMSAILYHAIITLHGYIIYMDTIIK